MDQESRDANSLLLELDKGLQSSNTGDQSEAVARFTNLFQRFPLPILINSACLKLAEAFRCGSNFIRVQIAEVFDRNQIHLNKIYSIDEFYRNLFTVTTSNDPIARSITLITLGKIASIVSCYKSIHHCISSSLESTIECELKATISCAACYVKYSSEFACNIYPKIVSIVDSSKSSIEIKLAALSVLDHGFYNANDAMTVRSFLIDVIQTSKPKRLICACLTLSTKIAYTSLSHIRPQIELLLKIYLDDTRHVIKLNALRNLRFLAEKSPHIWESIHVDPLVSYLETSLTNVQDTHEDKFSVTILSIFCKLLTCKCNFIDQQEKHRIFQQCYKLALNNNNIPLCSMAFELLAVMLEEHAHINSLLVEPKANGFVDHPPSEITKSTFATVQKYITRSLLDSALIDAVSEREKSLYKAIYRHIVKICNLDPKLWLELGVIVMESITDKKFRLQDLNPYVTEMLCALIHDKALIFSNEEGLKSIKKTCDQLLKTRSAILSDTNLLNLSVLKFQINLLDYTGTHVPYEHLEFIPNILSERDLWFRFKVLRQAMRFGLYTLASNICKQLHEYVTTDTTDFYLKSLSRICDAETALFLAKDFDIGLRDALPIYEEAVSPLRASICNSQITDFQLQYVCLRIRSLQTLGTLRQCCKIYETSPITYATLLNAINATRGGGDSSLTKHGVMQQMPRIAKEFRYIADCYENLSIVSFNCDVRTLEYLLLIKCSCILMADAIDAIFQYGKNLPALSKLPVKEFALEQAETSLTNQFFFTQIRDKILKQGAITPSANSIEPLIELLRDFSDEILKLPFLYPRYFFQPLQATQIKLAITPQPTSPSGSIDLILNYNLVLKVEGLIQNTSKTKIVIREVSKVIISVVMSSTKSSELGLNFHVKSTTSPHNNYFKAEFLLPLKWTGLFNVDIEVSIIDEHEQIWKTGPTEKLSLAVS